MAQPADDRQSVDRAVITANSNAAFVASLLEHIPCAVVATGPDGTVLYWNPGAEALSGWAAHETVGRSIDDLMLQEGQGRYIANGLRGASGSEWHGEMELRRRDGSIFPALVTLKPISAIGSNHGLVLGVIIDLSERRALEVKLLQSQKMEAVGTLAGGLAHDFNNLLTGVLGSACLIREIPDRNRDVDELVDVVERAALRGRDLCHQLLSFSRVERPNVEFVDGLEMLGEVVMIAERTFPKDIKISVDVASDLPALLADHSRLNQAIMNLMMNARDAMVDAGVLNVRAVLSIGVPADELHVAEESDVRYVRLDVKDTGEGMSPEVLRRMFEPFFTTKASGKGTGLGLPMVFAIVRAHGGSVRVWSKEGEGTCVSLFVPAAEGKHQAVVESFSESDLEGFSGSETILIVDDEAIVRNVGARILRQFGYVTVEAAGGPEALRIVEQRGDEISAILLDIIMPEMDGAEVFRRLCEQAPHIPVLLCSGFSVDGISDDLLRRGAAGFVQKPYKLNELMPLLRSTLERRANRTS